MDKIVDTAEIMADEFRIAYPLTYDAIYNRGRSDALEEQKELMYALADQVLKSQFGDCLTCENHMKNITIDGVRNGCDGSCSHSKEWTVEEFIDLFAQELKLEKRLKGGENNGV